MAESFGNRCGHRPDKPELRPPGLQEHSHAFVLQAVEALDKRYFSPEDFFLGRVAGTRQTAHPIMRQARSERREAISKVGTAMLHFTNLDTLAIETQRGSGLVGIDLDYLCRVTRLSLHRVCAAIRDMRDLGYLRSKMNRRLLPDGTYENAPADRWFSLTFFRCLGLNVALDMVQRRRKKHERRVEREKQPPPVKESATGFGRPLRQLVFRLTGEGQAAAKVSQVQSKALSGPDEREARMRWMLACLKLREAHPDWDADTIRLKAWDSV